MVLQKKKMTKERFLKAFKRDKYLYLLFLPILIWYIIFCYLPMGGLVIAFQEFSPGLGLFKSKFVGFKWFIQFFGSPFAYRLVRNTVLISLYSLVFGFPVPILFAVCVTELRNTAIRKTVQTVSYLPHFISTVVVVGMIKNFLSMNDGIINNFIALLGGERINFLMDPKYFRTIYVASGVWQSFGYSSIIYIAAIVGIDPSLYESAKIDGITKFKEVWYITVPMIAPTITILFIMQLGRIMSVGFEKVFLLYSPGVYETADVISTYVYRKGIESSEYGFSTAVGLFNSVINFLFVFGANQVCHKLTNTSLW
ncbi:MAG: sugar ABC transporter permease [Clostridiales bacterium]|nr:sugar ABC transporter permease [Clostridiales bacterium]